MTKSAKSRINRQIWENLEKLRKKEKISNAGWRKVLGCSETRYRLLSEGLEEPNLLEIGNVCASFEVRFSSLVPFPNRRG
jgi:hypothetical protein